MKKHPSIKQQTNKERLEILIKTGLVKKGSIFLAQHSVHSSR